MKNIFFTLCTILFLYNTANAQYCGASDPSGPTVCDTVKLAAPGFSPPTDSLPPLVNGQVSTTIIYLQNYDTVSGNTITALTIDTISNLPDGICWSTNNSANTFGNQQNGCIKLVGTPCAPTGQYKIHATATINHFVPVDLADYNLNYWIRVINTGDTITPVDSTQQPFISYNHAATGCTTGVTDLESAINSLSLYPNPMGSTMQVKLFSTINGEMTERITNILGGEVHKMVRNVHTGTNSYTVDRNNLPAGVYFYSLTEGQTVITRRMIISD